jgi:methylmalonyl-CoA mutase N-terminal domain/subunit
MRGGPSNDCSCTVNVAGPSVRASRPTSTAASSGRCGSTPAFTPEESNERYRYLLAQGQTGLSVAFDLPTQMGYDSDDPRARGRGRQGRRRDRLDRRHGALFDGIPLDEVSTSMTINATAIDPARALRRSSPRSRASPGEALRHDPERHPQGVHRARHYIYPPRPSMRLVTDIFAFCARECRTGTRSRSAATTSARRARRPCRSRVHARERHRVRAGARRRRARRRRVRPRSRSSSTRTTTSSRRSRSSAPRGGCGRGSCATASARRTPRAAAALPHADRRQTLTAQQPDNNIVRVAMQALAAVLGGTQSLHTNGSTRRWRCRPRRRRDRAAHAADHRARERRRQHRRSARRLVRRRAARMRESSGISSPCSSFG